MNTLILNKFPNFLKLLMFLDCFNVNIHMDNTGNEFQNIFDNIKKDNLRGFSYPEISPNNMTNNFLNLSNVNSPNNMSNVDLNKK